MSKISISQAARMAGISRQHLYKSYINAGKLSVIKDNNKVYVEVSELVRVFPDCKLDSQDTLHVLTPENTESLQNNAELISMLKTQLAEAREREDWLKSQIDELRLQQGSLLENKKPQRKKLFGFL